MGKDLTRQDDLYNELRRIDDSYQVESAVFMDWIAEHELDLLEGYEPFIEHLKTDGYERHGRHREYSAAAINKYIQAIRNRIRYAFTHSPHYQDMGKRMELDEFLKSVRTVKKATNQVSKARVLSWSEVSALIQKTRGTRTGLMIEFLARTGVRVSEMLNMKLSAIRENGAGFDYIRIIGKGNKERDVKVQRELVERIRETFQGSEYLFEHNGEQYNRISVTNMIKAASLRHIGREASAHVLRHSFATEQLRRDRPLKAVSEYLGHSSVATTADIYLHEQLDDDQADLAADPVFDKTTHELRGEIASLKQQMTMILDQFRDGPGRQTRTEDPDEKQTPLIPDEAEELVQAMREQFQDPEPGEEKKILEALDRALKTVHAKRRAK